MIRAIQEIQYGVAQCRSWKRKDEAWRTYSLDQSHLKRIKTVHVQSVLAIEIDSSDARFLLSGDLAGSICIYDMQNTMKIGEQVTFKPIVHIKKSTHVQAPRSGVTAVAWNPVDTSLFMTGQYDKRACVWDTNELVMVHAFRFDSQVNVVKISPLHQSALVAVGSEEREVSLCDLRLGETAQVLSGHTDSITSLSWSPSNEFSLVTGSSDGSMKLWDLRKSGSVLSFDYMKTTENKKKKRSSPNVLNQYESDEGEEEAKEDGKGRKRRNVSLNSSQSMSTSLSHDETSSTMMTNVGNRGLGGNGIMSVHMRSVRREKEEKMNRRNNPSSLTRPETAHQGRVTDILFTPCGTQILSTGTDNMMRLWEAEKLGLNKMVHYPDTRNDIRHPARICLSNNGSLVYHPNREKISVLEVETGKKVHSLNSHFSHVTALSFHPALPELYSSSSDGQILVWTPFHEEARHLHASNENKVIAFRRMNNNTLPDDEEIADWNDDED